MLGVMNVDGHWDGCLLGNMGAQRSEGTEQLQGRIREVSLDLHSRIAYCLKAAVSAGELAKGTDVNGLATLIQASLEGAVLSARTTQSRKPMEVFERLSSMRYCGSLASSRCVIPLSRVLRRLGTGLSSKNKEAAVAQGLHGRRIAQHLGINSFSTLMLQTASEQGLALTHLSAPHGIVGASKRVAPEAAHIVTVHLKRPGLVQGWGSWVEGRFRPVTFWDLGGIELFDLRADPVVLRESAFETVHVYVPHRTLQTHAHEAGHSSMPSFTVEPGKKDDVMLRWARTMLPFFAGRNSLPAMAAEELVSMFCSYLLATYGKTSRPVTDGMGELALWQKRRSIQMIHERIGEQLTLSDLATECRLSPSHFARAFKRSFGMPAHKYLVKQRVELAQNLLLHSELPLLSIALECGFADQSAFNRCFRAVVKTSPGVWQREQRSAPVRFAYTSVVMTPSSATSVANSL